MCGACGVLINITGGKDMTLYEVDSAANRVREEVGDSDANIIFGSTFNPELEGVIRVSVVATGIDQSNMDFLKNEEKVEKVEEKDYQEDSFTSESIEIDSHEPPFYNEYEEKEKGNETELQEKLERLSRQMDWAQSEQFAAMEKAAVSEQKLKAKPQSFLKRMWNSLKASDVQQEVKIQNNQQESMPPSFHEKKSDIQDMPSFIRKDS